jgi:hypothetical protein
MFRPGKSGSDDDGAQKIPCHALRDKREKKKPCFIANVGHEMSDNLLTRIWN